VMVLACAITADPAKIAATMAKGTGRRKDMGNTLIKLSEEIGY